MVCRLPNESRLGLSNTPPPPSLFQTPTPTHLLHVTHPPHRPVGFPVGRSGKGCAPHPPGTCQLSSADSRRLGMAVGGVAAVGGSLHLIKEGKGKKGGGVCLRRVLAVESSPPSPRCRLIEGFTVFCSITRAPLSSSSVSSSLFTSSSHCCRDKV